MEQKVYILEGRQFRTEGDYARAKRDKELIDKIREKTDFENIEELKALRKELCGGSYRFLTILERDFQDEIDEQIKRLDSAANNARSGKRTGKTKKTRNLKDTKTAGSSRGSKASVAVKERGRGSTGTERSEAGRSGKTGQKDSASGKMDAAMEESVKEELKKREKRRKLILISCSLAAICSLGYFSVYSYFAYRTQNNYKELSELKEKAEAAAASAASASAPAAPESSEGPLYTLDEEPEQKEVLDEYKELLQRNRKLIGWITIEGTNIDYPVMQTTDNEYYLSHNMNQEYDRNGTIFMDKDCDVLKPSTNYILYGHHMMNGKMFGQLDLYQKESFCEEHPYISFDTIYEKGTYQVMYVFKETVHKETEVVFKYYQFIDANGPTEFDSYMQEMAEMSLYDTGVTAEYGDQLLTLSTCNERETDGRFVVVAKKIAEE